MTNDWIFLDHIEKSLQKDRYGDKKHPYLWPSEASAVVTNKYGEDEVIGACRRKTFFRYLTDAFEFYETGYEHWQPLIEEISRWKTKPDNYMVWIWMMGRIYEQFLVQEAMKAGVFINREVTVFIKPHWVSGRIDLIVINPLTGKRSIIEVKSVYGYGADVVRGKFLKTKTIAGKPRDSAMMQLALYDYWVAQRDPTFEKSQLSYGDRGTGKKAAFYVWTESDGEQSKIYWQQKLPKEFDVVTAPMTVENILSQYDFVRDSVKSNVIPERDFDLQYPQERIAQLYERGELTESDTERFEKHKAYLEGKRRKINPVQMSDWQCTTCDFARVCYDKNNKPRSL